MIASLFAAEVKTSADSIDRLSGELYPEETVLVSPAIAQRRREFIAGRVCARRALAQLGVGGVPIPAKEDRAPVWPNNIVGSISHSSTYCGAAVAFGSSIRSVGLDLEDTSNFEIAFLPAVCTQNELKRLSALPPGLRRRLGALVFSAKECFYKCQYPLTKQWVGFLEVEIDLDPSAGEFSVVIPERMRSVLDCTRLFGHCSCDDQLVMSGLTLLWS